MPAGYLHARCAALAAEGLSLSEEERAAYLLGCFGPDPLFAIGIRPLRASSRPARYAAILHTRRTNRFLIALLEEARAAGNVEWAYALGFLTHYALDSTAHPHVNRQSMKNGRYSSTLHMALEKRWDARRYLKDGLSGTPTWLPGLDETLPCWDRVARVFGMAAEEAFPEETELRAPLMARALSESRAICALTHSPRGVKYALCWLLERLLWHPGLITAQITPRHPRHDADERTELALFDRGVARARALIRAALLYCGEHLDEDEMAEALGNLGYDTGTESLP